MCISVVFVLQSFLCPTVLLEALNSLFLAFLLTGILVIVDVFKCVILTFFPLVAFYGLSSFLPTLQSLEIFFYCNNLWFLLQSDISISFIELTCLILLNEFH